MSIVDFIGFVIAFVALFFIFVRQRIEQRKRQQNPHLYDQDAHTHGQTLEEYLKALEEEEDSEYKRRNQPQHPRMQLPKPSPSLIPAQTRPKQLPAPAQKSKPENYRTESAVEKRRLQQQSEAYGVVRDDKMSRGFLLVSKLKSRRDMFIYKEIFDKPLSMRDDIDPSKEQSRGRK